MNYRKTLAYTLAEMLIVLVILSIVLLAAPPLTKKLFKVKTTEKKHGRFECYYNPSGQLTQYYAVDGQPAVGPNPVSGDACTFNPPSNALYIMIHAVGGGGAGYADIGSVGSGDNISEEIVAISYPSYSAIGLWPEWFKYLMNHNESDLKVLTIVSNSYEIKKTFMDQTLTYGLAGAQGERISMFFPSLSSQIAISMKPGLGALSTSTERGGDTKVYFKYPSDNTPKQVILAKGGKSATSKSKFSSALSGGAPTDFGVGKFQAVSLKSSTFEDVIENADTQHGSTINTEDWPQKAGWGGNGAYFFLGNNAINGAYTYQVNNFEQKVNEEGNFVKNDYWKTVTNLLPTYFYKRDGQTGKCSLTSGNIEISGSCYQKRAETNYTCEIKNGDTKATLIGYSNCTSGNCLSSSTAAGLTNCKFIPATLEFSCIKSSVSGGKHSCTYDNNFSLSDFTCPEGIETEIKTQNYGICKAGRGGNGAVIILW